MGILDEAIREHLELKRQHGAEESELKGLEDEAFGPADRPDATSPASSAEAETQIISPGSSLTAPAGEGDQLDKVFEQTRRAESARGETETDPVETAADASTGADATFAEHPIPEPPAPEAKAGPEPADAATVEPPEAKPAAPEAKTESGSEAAPETHDGSESTPGPEASGGPGDAGDLLEAERQHLASHPTEHYDVDAAIAEEDEIDILSESSLSDELDRALDSGEVESGTGRPAGSPTPTEPDSGELDATEPDSGEPEAEAAPAAPEQPEDSAELLYEDAATESQPVEDEQAGEEEETGEEDEGRSASFFDQDDVLEGTPDFLEETPEHDQLWFEQKEPKDFDFGD